MTSICLIRHGETDWNKQKRLQGATDIPLNDTGIQQANEVRRLLRDSDWDLIVTSPLSRAKRTAEIINEDLQLPLLELDELKERSFGIGEGMFFEDIKGKYPNREFENKEPTEDFQFRIMQGIDQLSEKYPSKKILLVAHGAVINMILSIVSKGEIGTGKTRLVNACLSNIQHNRSEWTIQNYNQIDHLSDFQQ
ncbi:histidine phosphatase family protein [Halalkalibacillus sediminis]|uniref:Histidine phosphatase family protein n=1 Tax=Halalkalibacillus sediminis TaxID=2018042 RepID=A0A2I0QRC5_9BACI|nr:histidine phosphatase family protein [Halalkalibacillus sediminis]PKR76884.1 histidine phosphatase family protein [Halalkalibacillus sediminis]